MEETFIDPSIALHKFFTCMVYPNLDNWEQPKKYCERRSIKMKKIWIIAGLLGITVLALGAAGLAYAQSGTPQPVTPPGYGNGMIGGRGNFAGMRGGYISGEEGPNHDYMIDVFAEAIGLSPEEVETRLASGETMWQIVESEGVAMEEFGEIMSQVHSDFIQQALDDGTLTQEHADFMASHRAAGGFGQGFGDCMGDSAYGGFHHGRQGWRNTP